MTYPIRSILALLILVVVAACSSTVAAPTSETPTPTAPADPTVAPSEEPADEVEVDGTITVAPGVADGLGGSVEDALAAAMTQPVLVNGVIFRDADGKIFLATSLTDATAPTFGGPILAVENYPDNTAEWDMATGELIGLQEANGILFREGAQVFGVVTP